MKKQFIVAVVATSILANGASVAFAAKVSDSGNSSSSTTVAAKPDNDNEATEEKKTEEPKTAKEKKTEEPKTAKGKKTEEPKTATPTKTEEPKTPTEMKIDEQKVGLTKVLETKKARDSILAIFKGAMANANKVRYAALKSARTNLERKAAIDAFNIAVTTASQAKNTALKALTAD